MPSVTDRLLIMYGISSTSCSSLQQLYIVDNGIFYMAGVNIFLLVNFIMNILPDKYFKTVFPVAKFYMAICFNYFLSIAIF